MARINLDTGIIYIQKSCKNILLWLNIIQVAEWLSQWSQFALSLFCSFNNEFTSKQMARHLACNGVFGVGRNSFWLYVIMLLRMYFYKLGRNPGSKCLQSFVLCCLMKNTEISCRIVDVVWVPKYFWYEDFHWVYI